jgi:Phage protein (N4 Gp49/phage Sf6 gene 66) family
VSEREPSATRLADDLAKAVQKTPHRVSLDDIIGKIQHYDYINPERYPHITICLIGMKNGFVVIGSSAPADPQNFDRDLGRQFAKEDAIRQLWRLEGYLLRERLAKADA